MSVNPTAMRRLMREIKQLQTEPPEGIRISTSEENILDVTGIIQGPDGTPYQGGYFKIKFKFTEEFPAAPPKCWFLTKVFHPNVSKAGEICVNTLKKDWKREYGITHILVTVKCLLIYPNPESALDEAAGKLLLEKYEDYCKQAKLMTSVHAMPKTRPPEFDIPSVIPDTKPSASAPSTSTLAPAAPAAPTARLTSPAPPKSSGANNPAVHNIQNEDAGLSSAPAKPISSSSTSKAPAVEPLQSTSNQNIDTARPAVAADPIDMKKSVVVKSAKAASTGTGTPTSNTAMKRGNPAAAGGAEKRKKGLKRL